MFRRRHKDIHPLAQTTGSERLACGAFVGLVVGLVPWTSAPEVRALAGWCAGVVTYVALAWWLAHAFDSKMTRERAQAQDPPSVLVFFFMIVAVLASVAAIASMLQQVKADHGNGQRAWLIGLAMFALFCSWLLIHAIFAFRYAHRYYQEEMRKDPDGPGLIFPGKDDPDYFDFLYYSFVVGMTSQVSDVQITSREMRRITLIHSVLAFTFNMLVLALSINVVAGAI